MSAVLGGYERFLVRAELAVRFARRWLPAGLFVIFAASGALIAWGPRPVAGIWPTLTAVSGIWLWLVFRSFARAKAQAEVIDLASKAVALPSSHDEDRVARIAEEADRAARRGR